MTLSKEFHETPCSENIIRIQLMMNDKKWLKSVIKISFHLTLIPDNFICDSVVYKTSFFYIPIQKHFKFISMFTHH